MVSLFAVYYNPHDATHSAILAGSVPVRVCSLQLPICIAHSHVSREAPHTRNTVPQTVCILPNHRSSRSPSPSTTKVRISCFDHTLTKAHATDIAPLEQPQIVSALVFRQCMLCVLMHLMGDIMHGANHLPTHHQALCVADCLTCTLHAFTFHQPLCTLTPMLRTPSIVCTTLPFHLFPRS